MKNLYLAHHGIKGQKWGVRRYQNKDGSLTDLGKKIRNYNRTIDSLTDEEYRLFSDGGDRNEERAFIKTTAVIELENVRSQKTALRAGFRDAGYTRMNDDSIRKRYVYD